MSNSTSGGDACNNFSRHGDASPQFTSPKNGLADDPRLTASGASRRSGEVAKPRSKKSELRDDDAQKSPILGNYAESSPLFEGLTSLKPTIGEASEPSEKNKTQRPTNIWDFDAQTAEKYALQAMARKAMLQDFYSIPKGKRPKKPHRVCNCRRDLRPVEVGRDAKGKRQFVMSKPEIYKHIATGNTFFGGLMVCGSPYACPVDVSKVNETRATEIRAAVSQWVAEGGICLFVTLTFPHTRFDKFSEMMPTFTKGALVRFRKGKNYDKIKDDLGYFSFIRSIEVTWGEANGFHPHSHEIWFVKPDFLYQHPVVDWSSFDKPSLSGMGKELKQFLLEPMKMRIYDKWRAACVDSGLSAPSYERGVDVLIAETEAELQERLAEYMAKTGLEKPPWGVDDEMTRHNVKRGKPGRFTPFDFLRQQFNPELTKEQKNRFLRLFAEYVNGFKGTAKVYWPSGLKAYFNVQDLTDEQIAEQQTEQSALEYTVPPFIWVFVVAINDHRAELLLKVKNEGVDAAKQFLSSLLDRYAEYLDERYDELPAVYQYILESINEVHHGS